MTRIDDNPSLANLLKILTRRALLAWVHRHRYDRSVRDLARAEFLRRRAAHEAY